MAKQKGPNKMVGFIDGKIYYMMNGEYYVRNPSSPSKKKINNDPAYRSTKNNAKEFGAASSIGTVFKKSFGSLIDGVSDRGLYRRICGLFNKLIHLGHGKEGTRSIEISSGKNLLKDFQFNEEFNFNYLFKASYSLNADEDRKKVFLSIPPFKPHSGISKIPGATHFKMVLLVLIFSDYLFDKVHDKYLPTDPAINKLCVTTFSDLVSLNDVTEQISLSVQLQVNNIMPETVGLVTCVGIEFYQEVAGKAYLLESMNCMKIADVF